MLSDQSIIDSCDVPFWTLSLSLPSLPPSHRRRKITTAEVSLPRTINVITRTFLQHFGCYKLYLVYALLDLYIRTALTPLQLGIHRECIYSNYVDSPDMQSINRTNNLNNSVTVLSIATIYIYYPHLATRYVVFLTCQDIPKSNAGICGNMQIFMKFCIYSQTIHGSVYIRLSVASQVKDHLLLITKHNMQKNTNPSSPTTSLTQCPRQLYG